MAERPQIRKLTYLPQQKKWQWQHLLTGNRIDRKWLDFGPPHKSKQEAKNWMNTKGDRQL